MLLLQDKKGLGEKGAQTYTAVVVLGCLFLSLASLTVGSSGFYRTGPSSSLWGSPRFL